MPPVWGQTEASLTGAVSFLTLVIDCQNSFLRDLCRYFTSRLPLAGIYAGETPAICSQTASYVRI